MTLGVQPRYCYRQNLANFAALVSNQSGVARGRIRVEQVEAVNRRVEELLGPLGPWMVCPPGPGDGGG